MPAYTCTRATFAAQSSIQRVPEHPWTTKIIAGTSLTPGLKPKRKLHRKAMSINSWCLIPKNRQTPLIMEPLLNTEPSKCDIFCQTYRSEPKVREFSILPARKKKLRPILKHQIQLHEGVLFCKRKATRSIWFSCLPKPTLRLFVQTSPTNGA